MDEKKADLTMEIKESKANSEQALRPNNEQMQKPNSELTTISEQPLQSTSPSSHDLTGHTRAHYGGSNLGDFTL